MSGFINLNEDEIRSVREVAKEGEVLIPIVGSLGEMKHQANACAIDIEDFKRVAREAMIHLVETRMFKRFRIEEKLEREVDAMVERACKLALNNLNLKGAVEEILTKKLKETVAGAVERQFSFAIKADLIDKGST